MKCASSLSAPSFFQSSSLANTSLATEPGHDLTIKVPGDIPDKHCLELATSATVVAMHQDLQLSPVISNLLSSLFTNCPNLKELTLKDCRICSDHLRYVFGSTVNYLYTEGCLFDGDKRMKDIFNFLSHNMSRYRVLKIVVYANGRSIDWLACPAKHDLVSNLSDLSEPATTLLLMLPGILPDGLNLSHIESLLITGPAFSHNSFISLSRMAFIGLAIDYYNVYNFFRQPNLGSICLLSCSSNVHFPYKGTIGYDLIDHAYVLSSLANPIGSLSKDLYSIVVVSPTSIHSRQQKALNIFDYHELIENPKFRSLTSISMRDVSLKEDHLRYLANSSLRRFEFHNCSFIKSAAQAGNLLCEKETAPLPQASLQALLRARHYVATVENSFNSLQPPLTCNSFYQAIPVMTWPLTLAQSYIPGLHNKWISLNDYEEGALWRDFFHANNSSTSRFFYVDVLLITLPKPASPAYCLDGVSSLVIQISKDNNNFSDGVRYISSQSHTSLMTTLHATVDRIRGPLKEVTLVEMSINQSWICILSKLNPEKLYLEDCWLEPNTLLDLQHFPGLKEIHATLRTIRKSCIRLPQNLVTIEINLSKSRDQPDSMSSTKPTSVLSIESTTVSSIEPTTVSIAEQMLLITRSSSFIENK
jgi:hypothetical protein